MCKDMALKADPLLQGNRVKSGSPLGQRVGFPLLNARPHTPGNIDVTYGYLISLFPKSPESAIEHFFFLLPTDCSHGFLHQGKQLGIIMQPRCWSSQLRG